MELYELTAHELLKKMKKKEISSEEIVICPFIIELVRWRINFIVSLP